MLKNISNLGSVLSKKDQREVQGGSFGCQVCRDICRSHNYQTREEFSECMYECRLDLC